jgi:ribosome assembly protein YihI (activator of Der GTPase)
VRAESAVHDHTGHHNGNRAARVGKTKRRQVDVRSDTKIGSLCRCLTLIYDSTMACSSVRTGRNTWKSVREHECARERLQRSHLARE